MKMPPRGLDVRALLALVLMMAAVFSSAGSHAGQRTAMVLSPQRVVQGDAASCGATRPVGSPFALHPVPWSPTTGQAH